MVRSDVYITAVRDCIGGNAEDIGETCCCWLVPDASPSSDNDAGLKLLGAPLVLGVLGAADDD